MLSQQLINGVSASNTAWGIHLAGAAVGAVWAWGGGIAKQIGLVRDAVEQRQHEREELDQEKVDQLLEKVTTSGLTSLSKKERNFLERYRQRQLRERGSPRD